MIAIDEKTRSAAMLISSVPFRAFFLGIGMLMLAGSFVDVCNTLPRVRGGSDAVATGERLSKHLQNNVSPFHT